MTGLMRGLKGVVLLGAGVAITGCSQLGGLENVLGGVLGPQAGSGNASEVYGVVRGVDTQRQMIQIQRRQFLLMLEQRLVHLPKFPFLPGTNCCFCCFVGFLMNFK